MKKIFISLFLSTSVYAQNVGIGTNAPDASAMLDITSTTRGILIPRIALSATNLAAPVTAPTTSLVVYNTATAGVAPNNVTPGYYYWNGTIWVRFASGNAGWELLGNYGTNPGANFVGTKDPQDLVFRTNDIEKMRILSAGNVGINTNAPATRLDLNGDIAWREGTALALANGVNSNLAVGTNSYLRITGPTAAFSITGLAGGVNGKIVTLVNTTAYPMTISHNVTSTAANRIYTPGSSPLLLDVQYGTVTLQYNSTLTRWVVLSYTKKDGTDWLLEGNAGINDPAVPVTYGTSPIVAGENWIGTKDANDIVLGTDNIERARIKQTNGFVGIGTATPAASLEIYNNSTVPVPQLLLRENGNDYARLTYMNTNTTTKYWTNSAILDAATDNASVWNVYYNNGVGTNIFSVTGNNRAGVMVNQAPNTSFDINGDIAWREGTALALANGANNNIAPGSTSHIRITGPTAAFTISGITAGVDGKIINIINTTTQTMTITNNDAASTAANRIYTPGATALILEGQYATISLQYNRTLARWVVISNTDGLVTDHDIYAVGTTVSPAAITDNKYTLGTLAVGHTDPLSHTLLVGSTTPILKIGQTGGLNNIESGRIIFDEGAQTYTAGTYCGLEIQHDGAANRLYINGGCTGVTQGIATFERTGDVGIMTTNPTEQLEIGGTDSKIYLNSATSNMLTFNTNGVAAPALTTRSVGTKIVLYPQVSATEVDYAIGITGSTQWYSVPDAVAAYNFRWYGGTSELMRLRGDGRLGIGIAAPTATRLQAYDPNIGTTRIAVFRNGNADGTEVQVGSVEYLHDYASTTDFNDGANTVGLTINFNASSGYDLQLANNLAAKPTSNAWTVVSDARLKEDIHPFKDGLATLKQINPVYFKYNGRANTPANDYGIGILAQDMQKVAPYTIGTWEYLPDESNKNNIEKYLSYNNDALHYVQINAIKELDEKQSKIQQTFKNISDFGVLTLSQKETFIPFSSDFAQNISSLPVVTLTSIQSTAQLTITSTTATGFTVKINSEHSSVQINWIAMGKVKSEALNVESNYSETERQEMINKVKIPDTRLKQRIDRENAELEKFQKQLKLSEEADKQAAKVKMPNQDVMETPKSDDIETPTPQDQKK